MMRFYIMGIMIVGLFQTSCTSFLLKTGIKIAEPYFHGAESDEVRLERISSKIYSFRWYWYRNLIVVTDIGFVVIDPLNTEAAQLLAHALSDKFPNQHVHTVIYSHYHLDHVGGGKALSPTQIIAHKKCRDYWKDFSVKDLLLPTQWISGDQILKIGDVRIEAFYLGLSHTDTLYAFYFPEEKLLFTADLGLVKTVPPIGVPDHYHPGYINALKRLTLLDFKVFVPSHFGRGTKQDLIDYVDMLSYSRTLVREAMDKYGTPGTRPDQFGDFFDLVYYPMREKYGKWHGFNEMFIMNMIRDTTGELLGY